MFKFLFVIFAFFILLLFLLGFSIFRTIKNLFFGRGNSGYKGNPYQQQQQQQNRTQNRSNSSTDNNAEPQGAASRKKIFTKDEGEYVDYEEVN